MDWQTSQRYILPFLPNAISFLDKHAPCNVNFATDGELSKLIADITTAAQERGETC